MKLAFTADLHYPTTSRSTLLSLASDIASQEPDVVALGGDIGEVYHSLDCFDACLSLFREALKDIPILVLPGNHDLWVPPEDVIWNSLDLFNDLLPRIVQTHGCHWLETENFIHGKVAIVGSYLHYDYSAKDTIGPASKLPDEWYEQNRDRILNDRFLKGLPRDREFAKQLGEGFRGRLQAAQDAPEIASIIVLTHVPCLEEQITRNPHNFNWAVATPYFGNLSHQQFIKEMSKVRYVVSGHSHKAAEATVDRGNMPVMTAINLDSDYRNPKFRCIELPDDV
jgi:predicted MPP superfamily phosphohydrolase